MAQKKGLPRPSKITYTEDVGLLANGMRLLKRGDYSIAESYLTRKAFEHKNRNFMLVLALADTKFLLGKLDEAEELYRGLIELSPAGYSHHGLALVLLRTDRAEEAEQHIKIAKSLGDLGRAPEYLPPLEE